MVTIQREFSLKSVAGETLLQNQYTVNVRVILYDIIVRKHIDSQTALTWGAWAPNQAWSAG